MNRLDIIKRIYVVMPNRKIVPFEDGVSLWGEVEGTQEWDTSCVIYDEIFSEFICIIEMLNALRDEQQDFAKSTSHNENYSLDDLNEIFKAIDKVF